MEKYLVIEYVSGLCGGYGDRLVGLVSAIQIAQVTNRKLLIKWDTDDLKVEFDYADYYKHTFSPTTKIKHLNCIDNQDQLRFYFINTDIIKEWNNYEIIIIRCNYNLGQYLYLNPFLKANSGSNNNIDPINYERDLRQIYQALYQIYLKPKSDLTNKISEYVHRFETVKKTGKSIIGLQIRTGDKFFKATGAEVVPNQDLFKIVGFFKDLLEDKLGLSAQNTCLFVCYDNPEVADIIKSIFSEYERIYHSAPIKHIGIVEDVINQSGFQKILIDQIMLSKTDRLLISNSNLSRCSYLMGDNQQTGYCLRYFKPNNEYQIYELSIKYASSKHMGINIWSDSVPAYIYK